MQTIEKIYFLAYEPRSGSTILSKYLTENYNVFVVPECNFIIDLLKRYCINHVLTNSDKADLLDLLANDRKLNDWGITEDLKEIIDISNSILISRFIVQILNLLNNKYSKNSVLILKKESYPSVFKQLVKIIREAKLLYIVRDPRAVFASQKHSIYTKTGQPFSTFCAKTAISWNLQLRRSYFVDSFVAETQFIKYEEFVIDPKSTTERFGFASIEISGGNESSYVLPEKYSRLHVNVGKQPNVDSLTKWRGKINFIETIIIEILCYRYMQEWGYKTSKSTDLLNSLGFVILASVIQSLALNIYKYMSKLPWDDDILFLEPK